MGFDLNRHWQDPSPWAHPTLHATKQYLMNLHSDPVSILIECILDVSIKKKLSKHLNLAVARNFFPYSCQVNWGHFKC